VSAPFPTGRERAAEPTPTLRAELPHRPSFLTLDASAGPTSRPPPRPEDGIDELLNGLARVIKINDPYPLQATPGTVMSRTPWRASPTAASRGAQMSLSTGSLVA
jgi:hypothetical protein